MTLEDIRDTDKDQYWETLRQRWGALMSYRYIGRQFSSMNKVDDDTVTLRHDMRNAAGGILQPDPLDQCAGRRWTLRPRGRAEPGHPLGADPRQRQRREAHRGRQRRRAQGRGRGCTSGGRRSSTPTTTIGCSRSSRGRVHRSATSPSTQGRPAVRRRPDRARRGFARSSADLAGLRREQARRRSLGARRAASRVRVTRCRVARRSPVRHPRDRRPRSRHRARGHRPVATGGRPLHVPRAVARSDRSGGRRAAGRDAPVASASSSPSTTRATATAP